MISKLLPCHRRIDTNYDRQPKSDFFATLQNAFLLVFALSVFSRLPVLFIDFSRHKIVYNQYEGHSPLKTWLHETFPLLLRGLWSDVGFAVICAIGLTFAVLTVKRSGVAVAFALVLAVVYAANATHHLYNLSDLSFSDAPMLTDETFLTSALGIPWLWAFAAANFVFVGLISILCRRFSTAKIATYVCLAAGLLIIVFRPEYEVSQPEWMQKNLFLPASVGTHETLGYDVPDLVASIPSQPLDTPGHNLLVIYLEGVSALSIHADSMPFLHALKAEALTLDRYIGPQLLTSRGLYASLTSHMPGFAFGDTRWAALNVDSPERRTALPRAMSDAGYHSSFLQAAPLAFMQKDRILPLLGFDEVYGLEHVPGQEFDGFWGQSDVNFLARLGNHILETDAAQARWFIAGLTVGTHAPYIVDRPAGTTKTDRQLALAAADRALESLLKQLDSSGVLNNTVIAI
ncbi:MAG: sulfatase-like hydrolase/transferase, partial [Rhodobacteraceae bacterium]|nr:sulfatase-like hydrolase/transferase [Paracoccaceae bacterium]